MPPADTELDDCLLPYCPMCMYSLRGLPREYKCPECGLAFDARSRMWIEPSWPGWRGFLTGSPGAKMTARIRSGLVLILIVLVIWKMSSFTCASFWLVVMILAGASNYRDAEYRGVGIVPDGLVVRRGRSKAELYKWDEVRRVRNTRNGVYVDVCRLAPVEIDVSRSIRNASVIFGWEVERRKNGPQKPPPSSG